MMMNQSQSMEQDEEEDCTVYIEELKSDDPSLKLNAIQKVQLIAETLGSVRTREELIPYLIEIIEECDNDNDFLINLSEQLLQLQNKIEDEQYLYLLISPLEILASMEEITVRQKAVECLKQLSQNQNQEFFQQHFISIIKQLAAWENYPSRISACNLLVYCFNKINQETQKEFLKLFNDLSHDDTPMVRRSVAIHISELCLVTTPEIIKKEILPLWLSLVYDAIDSVKISALESSVVLAKYLPKKDIYDNLLSTFKNIDANKKSWRVRYSVAENITQLVDYIDVDVIRTQIFDIIEQLLKDTEQEVKGIAILNLINICKFFTEAIIKSRLIPVLKQLASDPSPNVRKALADAICTIANHVELDTFMDCIFPIIKIQFNDETTEVKITIIAKLNAIHNIVGTTNLKEKVIPLIKAIMLDKNWRSKLAIVSYLPKLAEQFTFQLFHECLSSFYLSFLNDHHYAIREQTIQNIIAIKRIYGYEYFISMVENNVKLLVNNSNYLYRITSLMALGKMKEALAQDDLNNYFDYFFFPLINDKIPNVRQNAIILFKSLKKKLNSSNISKANQQLQGLKNDPDHEVKYQLESALN